MCGAYNEGGRDLRPLLHLFICLFNFRKRGHGEVWSECVVPKMKAAVTCVLSSTQDLIESRKASFELYGADFMISDDMR